ncbi:MAG: outer membrane protein assembly factor BamA [Rickettsiales endosymbiont of Dermacentor nuttalli]
MLRVFLLVLFFTVYNIHESRGEGQENWIVHSIIIEGNQRVENGTILNYMVIHKGDKFTYEAVDESLKSLFATGLFSDVSVRPSGNNIIVKVLENPTINQIAFDGNKKLKYDDLMKEIGLKSRMVYNKSLLQQDINHLVSVYHKMGRFAVSIVPKLIQLPQNRVDLVFEINEGPKTPIRKIFFIGNKRFSDAKLSALVNTKESRWYRFFSTSDNYDPDRLEYDKELLRRFYNSEGYPDFKVVSANAELTRDRSSFIITFSIEEGDRYNFGDIEIDNKLNTEYDQKLYKEIITKKGDIYDSDQIEDSIDAMTRLLNNRGFPFVSIEAVLDDNRQDRVINIKYLIEEGQRVYLNKINITGNVRTHDHVIRREFRIAEGDPYNASFINRSDQRIKNLDYFDKVEFTPTSTAHPDRLDINVEVEEKSTAKINLGGGYSTVDGIIGQISVSEDNFLGRGQQLGIAFMKASKKLDIDFSFTEPYFMDKELSVGIELFNNTADKKRWNPYKSVNVGIVPNIGYSINEYLYHALRYTLRKDKISDIDKDASYFIKEQQGKNIISSVGQSFVYDKTDNRVSPTKGYLLKLDQEIAGLGGNSGFFRNEVNVRYYVPIRRSGDIVLKLSGNAGYIAGLGKDVRINERFFIGDIGSYGFRGFAMGGIGPIVRSSSSRQREPLGSNAYYIGTAELSFPLGLPKDLDISGALFTDMGSAFGVDVKKSNKGINKGKIWDDKSLRMSIGTGVVWLTRIGPIRMDFAYPILKKKCDKSQYFHISFATSF